MGFEKVFALLNALGEDTDTTEIQNTLQSEIDEVTRISEGANAKVNELIAQNDDLMKELTEVKARNYELMVAATADVVSDEEKDDEEPEVPAIEDLFEEV